MLDAKGHRLRRLTHGDTRGAGDREVPIRLTLLQGTLGRGLFFSRLIRRAEAPMVMARCDVGHSAEAFQEVAMEDDIADLNKIDESLMTYDLSDEVSSKIYFQ
jgi:hypothetical protein